MSEVNLELSNREEIDAMDDVVNSLTVELKRGTQVLLVLSQLNTPEYGYSLVQKLEEQHAPIEAGTLYPMLRRLEKQGLLTSQWDTSEARPRKFYVLSQSGRQVYLRLREEWDSMAGLMDTMLRRDNP